ncbi:MAG: hypothetical protein RL417_1330 [Pseudomonadota bacterium]
MAGLVFPVAGAAQIYECSGRWTNKPCDGDVGRMIEEVSRPEPPQQASPVPGSPAPEPLAPRYSLIRKMKKLNDEYITRGVPGMDDAELDGFEALCLDPERPFVDCQNAYNEKSSRLLDLELAREANDLAAERNTIEQQKIDDRRRP